MSISSSPHAAASEDFASGAEDVGRLSKTVWTSEMNFSESRFASEYHEESVAVNRVW
jgi:hypothetical protein